MNIKDIKKAIEGVFIQPVKKYYIGRIRHGSPYFHPRKFTSSVIKIRKLSFVDNPDLTILENPRSHMQLKKVFINFPIVRRSKYWVRKIFGNWYFIELGYPIAIKTTNLGWKDKYNAPRYEWAPQFAIYFFRWQYITWWSSPVDDNDEYYEAILWYLHYADQDIVKAKETWPWQETATKESTWNNNFLI